MVSGELVKHFLASDDDDAAAKSAGTIPRKQLC